MFIGRNKANAEAQAFANAEHTGFAWYYFQDQYGAWRCEPEMPRNGKTFYVAEHRDIDPRAEESLA